MALFVNLVGRLPRSWIKFVGRLQWKHPWLKKASDWSVGRFRGRDGVIQQGVGEGLGFNTGDSNAGYLLGTSEPDMQGALRRLVRPGMAVYDVGANVGFLSLIAARLVGPTGRVVCFEPLPQNVAQIEHNVRLNGFDHVAVRSEALAATDEEAEFSVSAVSTWGKLRKIGTVQDEIKTILVPVRRLDTVIAEQALPDPHLIKIDVEGAEADVLRGAEQTLRRARPILLIELHGTNAAVADALDLLGYEARVLGEPTTARATRWDAKLVCLTPGRDAGVPIGELTSQELLS